MGSPGARPRPCSHSLRASSRLAGIEGGGGAANDVFGGVLAHAGTLEQRGGAARKVTSPRLRGEVGAKRRVRGSLSEFELVERAPHPNPLPAKSGERGCIEFLTARPRSVSPSVG